MKKQWKILALGLAVCAAAGCIWHFSRGGARSDKELKLTGNVDVREVSVAFRQSDRIVELLAEAGDKVQKGQTLARLDTRDLTLQLEKVQAEKAVQQSNAAKLHNGTRSEELRQAEERVRQAEAAAEHAALFYQRRQKIFDAVGGVSQQEVDTARFDAEAKAAALGVAQEMLAEAVNGPRREDIQSADAKLQSLAADEARLKYLLEQCELTAPADGVIRDRLLETGDMASPQQPVFKLSLLDKKWVRTYVKETDLGRVHEGQTARIYIDSRPDQPLTGQVGYISDTAEFTPKAVQTEDLRTALVYEVRVYVDDAGDVLRLGMPATVRLDL